jgi:hypothetical protein
VASDADVPALVIDNEARSFVQAPGLIVCTDIKQEGVGLVVTDATSPFGSPNVTSCSIRKTSSVDACEFHFQKYQFASLTDEPLECIVTSPNVHLEKQT